MSKESNVKTRLQDDLSAARKARDKERVVLFSTTLSDIHNAEIKKGGALTSDELQAVVAKAVKQRNDAAEQMRAGGRPELAEGEEREAAILSSYLPPPLSEDDVRALVREAIAGGANAMGPVMGRVLPQLRGRFDGKQANRIVREELGL